MTLAIDPYTDEAELGAFGENVVAHRGRARCDLRGTCDRTESRSRLREAPWTWRCHSAAMRLSGRDDRTPLCESGVLLLTHRDLLGYSRALPGAGSRPSPRAGPAITSMVPAIRRPVRGVGVVPRCSPGGGTIYDQSMTATSTVVPTPHAKPAC
jgi:hypothetical protein